LINHDLDREVEFFISLAQNDGRLKRGSKFPFPEQIHPVCVIVYPSKDGKKADEFNGANIKPEWISAVIEHKEVSLRIKMSKGKYLIVPSTREPGLVGQYYLSIYFNADINDIQIKNLTYPSSNGIEIKEEDEDVEVSELRRTIVQARIAELADKNKSNNKSFQQRQNIFGINKG
jgi:hypothetical protein